jgi:hypothetical protein
MPELVREQQDERHVQVPEPVEIGAEADDVDDDRSRRHDSRDPPPEPAV